MIRKIKKIFFGKNIVEIRKATMKNEEISFFSIKHPFLTRLEVVKLCAELYDHLLKNKDNLEKKRLVFEERKSFFKKSLTKNKK